MPKRTAPLTEMQVRKTKPADKPYRLADGKGLYLESFIGNGAAPVDEHTLDLFANQVADKVVRALDERDKRRKKS